MDELMTPSEVYEKGKQNLAAEDQPQELQTWEL